MVTVLKSHEIASDGLAIELYTNTQRYCVRSYDTDCGKTIQVMMFQSEEKAEEFYQSEIAKCNQFLTEI